MLGFLIRFHSDWRYLVILVAVVVIAKLLLGWLQNHRWSTWDQRLGLIAIIVIDIQVLLGILVWSLQMPRWSADPLRGMEHPVTMLLAIVAMHIGWSRAKKAESDSGRYRTAIIGFIVAGLLIGLGIARVTGTV
jgi:heme A synthase